MKLTLLILSALLGVSLAAPLPSAEEEKKIVVARQNPLSQITDIAGGLLVPVDIKNSGIDKLPAKLEDAVEDHQPGTHPGKQGAESPGNLVLGCLVV
ncbi:hypothetical protein DTO164E3_5965 [Paecilomyces variotii]|nr:hypothetical protein DTO164E3_5965 [Paecilomyces variotii]KAJ9197830.1 hypothetical protein DTO032I3_5787 [Paecilomyces variotii]KAJ9228998.1 hypothetical protein DTO169E5_8987 [Paecilomyces variotii]KAJ9277627.1 hypothetical protein DTO021D3_5461 [Paecilomyces variotii]KAJ9341887.1 hypothetical protein DTO027B6_5537 [Paecilomyces variotii]